MERAEAERRIEAYEVAARESPGRYRARVLAFAMLGFGVYGGIIVLTLALLGGTVALLVWNHSVFILKFGWKVILVLGGVLIGLFRAMRVHWEPPDGVALDERSAPELFRLLDELRARFRVRRLERVLLTDDLNAGVSQLPRWGLFGEANYLVLGLPLLQALSPDDMKAVLAHEFGHLSRNHSRTRAWIYRVVRTYENALGQLGSNRLLARFLNWYVPRLDVLSFPMRRQNEYEADQGSVEAVGAERTAQALVNVSVRNGAHDEFESSVRAQVRTAERPPAGLFNVWPRMLADQSRADAEQSLAEALSESTGFADTHPSLGDRLRAIRELAPASKLPDPHVEGVPERTAAEAFLGTSYAALVGSVGDHWCARVHQVWSAQHQMFVKKGEELRALEEERQKRVLSADEAFAYADLHEDVFPDRDPLPLFRAAHELYPDHKPTQFSLARLLLRRDDPNGVPLMEPFVSDEDLDFRAASAGHLAAFHRRNDNAAEFEKHRSVLQNAEAALERRAESLDSVLLTDEFVPHGLAEDAVQKLSSDFELFPEIRRAYLVKKRIPDSELPWYVVVLDTKFKLLASDEDKATLPHRVLEVVEVEGRITVFQLSDNREFKKTVTLVPGALIFER